VDTQHVIIEYLPTTTMNYPDRSGAFNASLRMTYGQAISKPPVFGIKVKLD
jgi:hypothetical protein